MNTDLTTKIRAALTECDALQEQHDANPYVASVIEAEGAITAAVTLQAEADKEPDRLAPTEIIAMRQRAETAKQVAEIELRRAQAQRRQFSNLLHQKALEIRGDAQKIIEEARTIFEDKIEAALIEISQGYWSSYTVGVSVPKSIAKHRGAALRRAENSLSDRFAQPEDFTQQIILIRRALDVALNHLESKP